MPGHGKKKRKKRSPAAIQRALENRRTTRAQKASRRAGLLDKPFDYNLSDEASARPTSGGQEHSPPKATDDGIQKYEKTLIYRQALKTLIDRGDLKPTSGPPRRRRQENVIAVSPRRAIDDNPLLHEEEDLDTPES